MFKYAIKNNNKTQKERNSTPRKTKKKHHVDFFGSGPITLSTETCGAFSSSGASSWTLGMKNITWLPSN